MDLYSMLQPGKDRSHVANLDPRFSEALARMIAEAPPEVQAQFQIMSGARSNERQAQLYEAAVKKYGSPEAARKWVAPPGKSFHNKGLATDLTYLGKDARKYAHDNAAKYNLAFPMGHEPWHIELAGVRGQKHDHAAPPNPVIPVDPNQTRALNAAPPEPILGADARQAAQQQQADMAAPEQSPLGNALGNLMSGFVNMGAQQQQPAGPRVLQDDSAQAIAAAQGLKERGAGLKSALTPDVTSLMAMGKRPPSGVI